MVKRYYLIALSTIMFGVCLNVFVTDRTPESSLGMSLACIFCVIAVIMQYAEDK